jgi:hypothetical protein
MNSLYRRLSHAPYAVLLALALVWAGCGGGSTADEPNVQIEVGERSPAIAGAQARFTAPEDGSVVDSASVDLTVEVDSFEAGIQTETPRAQEIANSSNGQHVHIIVDNGPYMANYNPGEPFDIGTLEEGPHTAVVFPSRSYHESVKNPGAHDIVNFYVGEESGEFMLNPDDPAIIYSRPKGTYSGAGAERIMLDFYLNNVELSADGYSARYTIRAADAAADADPLASITLDEWVPAFVTGLQSGTYVVTLELLDAEGNVVDGAFNSTEREITVERSEQGA